MFPVDRMSRWRRHLAGGMLAAVALMLLNHQAEPGAPAPASGSSSQVGAGGLAPADRDFLLRVRLAGVFPELGAAGLTPADRDFLLRVRFAGRGA